MPSCRENGNADVVRDMQGMLPPQAFRQAKRLLLIGAVSGGALVVTVVTGYVMASPTFGWTGVQLPSLRCRGVTTVRHAACSPSMRNTRWNMRFCTRLDRWPLTSAISRAKH